MDIYTQIHTLKELSQELESEFIRAEMSLSLRPLDVIECRNLCKQMVYKVEAITSFCDDLDEDEEYHHFE